MFLNVTAHYAAVIIIIGIAKHGLIIYNAFSRIEEFDTQNHYNDVGDGFFQTWF